MAYDNNRRATQNNFEARRKYHITIEVQVEFSGYLSEEDSEYLARKNLSSTNVIGAMHMCSYHVHSQAWPKSGSSNPVIVGIVRCQNDKEEGDKT